MVQITPLLNILAAVAQVSPAARNFSPNALAARQVDTSDLPSQCQTSCQVINTMTDCGTSITCICATDIGTELQVCMTCLTEADPSVESDAQSSLDSWNETCGGSLSLGGGTTGGSTSIGTSISTSSIGSVVTVTSASTTPSSSSSSTNPFSGKTGGAVSIKAATGAFGLAVAVACGILIL